MEEEYRIVQTADSVFIVEKLQHYTRRGAWPWSPRIAFSEWEPLGIPGHPFPFKTQEAAIKWVCDKRIYPKVVKQPV
jgi:hypothetical protein